MRHREPIQHLMRHNRQGGIRLFTADLYPHKLSTTTTNIQHQCAVRLIFYQRDTPTKCQIRLFCRRNNLNIQSGFALHLHQKLRRIHRPAASFCRDQPHRPNIIFIQFLLTLTQRFQGTFHCGIRQHRGFAYPFT